MKPQTMSRFVAASLGAVVVGACADPSTSPDRRISAGGPHAVVIVPDEQTSTAPAGLAFGDLQLCKEVLSGPAQTFTFNVSVDGGAPVQHLLAAGDCAIVAHSLRLNAQAVEVVTITEVAVPNWSISDIVLKRWIVPSPPLVLNPGAVLDEDDETATVGLNSDIIVRVTFQNTYTPPAGALFIILDEDAIDNDMRFDPTPSGPYSPHGPLGQDITPGTNTKFTKLNVNDDKPGKTQRAPLRYFSGPPYGPPFGTEITILSGQTGDEGWFAPTVAPTKWCTTAQINGGTCTTQQAIANFVGAGTGVPAQDKLDKTPEVVPLRALGLHLLEGRLLCAVVYDSDISINYDEGKTPFLTANLQGETLGIAAFTVVVHGVNRLRYFSSSTLPEVRLRIEDPAACRAPLSLFAAPVPRTSSIPNDIDPHNTPGVSSKGYKSIP